MAENTKQSQKILIAPSILSADFACLKKGIQEVEKGSADWIHLDVMDGRFVPNLTFGPLIVQAVNRITDLPLDVHLMIVEPEKYIEDFYRSGADWITVHSEATDHIPDNIRTIKQIGARAGISVKPRTPVSAIEPYLNEVDLVLVMSVEPGFGGQSFIPSSLNKISELADRRKRFGFNFKISVDGGVKENNAPSIIQAGADILVTGSYIFNSPSPFETLKKLRSIIDTL